MPNIRQEYKKKTALSSTRFEPQTFCKVRSLTNEPGNLCLLEGVIYIVNMHLYKDIFFISEYHTWPCDHLVNLSN